jgi:[ribosomal protein S18]-alanine N-acetyltransferase
MILEPAGPEAAAELAACHALSFDTPWSASDIEALLAAPGGYALAARDDADVRAFLLARAIAGEAEILTLAVDPPQRRQGLARALIEAAAGAASAAGAEAMFLEVAADNLAAIDLYGAAGFEPVGRRRGYYARPGGAIDALVLRRALNRPVG